MQPIRTPLKTELGLAAGAAAPSTPRGMMAQAARVAAPPRNAPPGCWIINHVLCVHGDSFNEHLCWRLYPIVVSRAPVSGRAGRQGPDPIVVAVRRRGRSPQIESAYSGDPMMRSGKDFTRACCAGRKGLWFNFGRRERGRGGNRSSFDL